MLKKFQSIFLQVLTSIYLLLKIIFNQGARDIPRYPAQITLCPCQPNAIPVNNMVSILQ